MQKCRFSIPSKDARMQIYNSFSGCRNHISLHGGIINSLICLRSPEPTMALLEDDDSLKRWSLESVPWVFGCVPFKGIV
jgi:hypothetical protein